MRRNAPSRQRILGRPSSDTPRPGAEYAGAACLSRSPPPASSAHCMALPGYSQGRADHDIDGSQPTPGLFPSHTITIAIHRHVELVRVLGRQHRDCFSRRRHRRQRKWGVTVVVRRDKIRTWSRRHPQPGRQVGSDTDNEWPAPFCSRHIATSTFPPATARCSGVFPHASTSCRLSPAFNSCQTACCHTRLR